MNITDFYTSIDTSKRDQEEYIIKTLTNHNIVPISIRFDDDNTVVQTINNKYYFFKGLDTENIAEVEEEDFTSKSYPFGCDLVKAYGGGIPSGTPPSGSGSSSGGSMGRGGAAGQPAGGGSGGVPSVEEEDDVQAQNDIITDRHPSGASSTTPDLPNRGRIWHEEQIVRSFDIDRLDNLSKSLNEMAPSSRYSEKEKEFMLSLGKTPEEIDSGTAKMSATQKVLFQKWLGKSLRNRIYSLQKAL